MARVAEERARVREHADEVAEHALVGERRHLGAHAHLVVVEPPGGAVLQLAGHGGALEARHDRVDHPGVVGVEAVEDGLGQAARLVDVVQEVGEVRGALAVADAVVAGVGAELGEHGGVVVALAAEVQLHGPAQAHVLGRGELHERGLVLEHVLLAELLARDAHGEDVLDLLVGGGHVDDVVERVVGGTASHLVEEVEALRERGLEVGEARDLAPADLGEVRHVLGEAVLLDGERLVRAHGRDHLEAEGLVGGEEPVPLEAVGRVVGRADQAHVGAAHEVAAGEVVLGELGVGEVPDLLGRLAVEHALIAEEAPELEVAPLVDGVADAALEGLRPLLELLARRGVAGDEALVDAVGAHEAPLVVVAAEPDLGDRGEALVLVDLLRGDVAVVVDDRHALRVVMEEPLARGRGEQEVLIVHEVLHRTLSSDS